MPIQQRAASRAALVCEWWFGDLSQQTAWSPSTCTSACGPSRLAPGSGGERQGQPEALAEGWFAEGWFAESRSRSRWTSSSRASSCPW